MTTMTPVSICADCGRDTIEAEEWYMVHDHVWEQAWGHISRGIPGEQILCIGCLEKRIGRTLIACDFTDAAVNDPFARVQSASERLFNRLIAKQPLLPNDMATLDDYLAWRDIELLPEKDERDAAWRAWKASDDRHAASGLCFGRGKGDTTEMAESRDERYVQGKMKWFSKHETTCVSPLSRSRNRTAAPGSSRRDRDQDSWK